MIAIYVVRWPDGSVGRLETRDRYVCYAEGYGRTWLFESIDAVRAGLAEAGASIERHDDRLG